MTWNVSTGNGTANNDIVRLTLGSHGITSGSLNVAPTLNTTNFTGSNADLTNGSDLELDDNAGAYTGLGWAYDEITGLTVGTLYELTCLTGATIDADAYVALSTTNDLTGVVAQTNTVNTASTTFERRFWKATATSIYVLVVGDWDTGSVVEFETLQLSYVTTSSATVYLAGYFPTLPKEVTAFAPDANNIIFEDLTGLVDDGDITTETTVYAGMWSTDQPWGDDDKAYYMVDKLGREGTVLANTEATDYPDDNLLLPYADALWRSANLTDQQIQRVYDVEWSVNLFVLAGHNFSQDARVQVTIRDDLDVVKGVFQLAVNDESHGWGVGTWGTDRWGGVKTEFPINRIIFYRLPDWFPCKEFDVDIFDSANVDGHMQCSFIYLDALYHPSCNPDYGYELDVVENSEEDEDGDFNPIVDPERDYVTMRFGYTSLTKEESHDFFMMKRIAGNRRNVFINTFPDSLNVMDLNARGLFRLSEWSASQIPNYDRWSVEFNAREITFE